MIKCNKIVKLFKNNQKRLFLTAITKYEKRLKFSFRKFTKQLGIKDLKLIEKINASSKEKYKMITI
jgi:hypothetical protein